jgi:hypothetical protein
MPTQGSAVHASLPPDGAIPASSSAQSQDSGKQQDNVVRGDRDEREPHSQESQDQQEGHSGACVRVCVCTHRCVCLYGFVCACVCKNGAQACAKIIINCNSSRKLVLVIGLCNMRGSLTPLLIALRVSLLHGSVVKSFMPCSLCFASISAKQMLMYFIERVGLQRPICQRLYAR